MDYGDTDESKVELHRKINELCKELNGEVVDINISTREIFSFYGNKKIVTDIKISISKDI